MGSLLGPSGAPQTDVNNRCLPRRLQKEARAARSLPHLQTAPLGKEEESAALLLILDLSFSFLLLFLPRLLFSLGFIPLMPMNTVYLLATKVRDALVGELPKQMDDLG